MLQKHAGIVPPGARFLANCIHAPFRWWIIELRYWIYGRTLSTNSSELSDFFFIHISLNYSDTLAWLPHSRIITDSISRCYHYSFLLLVPPQTYCFARCLHYATLSKELLPIPLHLTWLFIFSIITPIWSLVAPFLLQFQF